MELLKGKSVKGLFNKQKDDPEFLERQKRARNSLLKNLSKAVKEVQLLFTRSETGEIGDCRPVQRLCARFEDVLRHELKAGWTGKIPTFWPVVLKISRKQAIDYINKLQYAQSENGRCRAWIRMAVNECSLESYINVLCQDLNLLNQYYEAHSFLREEDTVIAMKQLLTGLSQVSFKITVDTASLEFAPAPEALQPALRIRAPLQMENASQGSGPSTASTPQASSSDGSWQSNSSSSSSNRFNIQGGSRDGGGVRYNNSKPKIPDTKEDSIVRMNDGLEVSVHQDEDSIVIEAPGLTKVNAYSNLKRFSLALEDTNNDWLTHEEYEPNKMEDMGVVVGSSSVDEGGIYMNMKGDRGSVKGDSPLVGIRQDLPTEGVPSRDDSPSLIQEPSPLSESHKSTLSTANLYRDQSQSPIDSRSPTHSPVSVVNGTGISLTAASEPSEVNNNILGSASLYSNKSPSPRKTTPDSPHKTPDFLHKTPDSPQKTFDSPQKTPESPQKTPDSPSHPNYEYMQEEYSFTEVLRLAAGVKPKSTEPEVQPKMISTSPLVDKGEVLPDDPYTNFINEDQATPKAEFGGDSMFLPTPDTPVANHTNPFMDDYEEPEPHPPSISHPSVIIATHMNPFDDSSGFNERGLSSNNVIQTFGNEYKLLIDEPHPSLNPFDEPNDSSSFDNTDNKHISPIDRRGSEHSPLVKSTNPRYTLSDLSVNVDFAKMVIKEDHYGQEMSVEEIDVKISKLKTYVQRDSSNQELKEALMILQMLKRRKLDALEEESMIEGVVVFGHTFQEVHLRITGGKKCDVCNKALQMPLLKKKSYQCASCEKYVHEKCLNSVTRTCVSQAVKKRTSYSMEIRPERGLTSQKFRCAKCNTALNTSSVEIRLCDYTGLYYCSNCHHNNLSLIPARILRNWDFDQRTVCNICAELLTALESRPLINIHIANPSLYRFISDIPEVESLRKDLLQMKSLLVDCSRAKEEKLLQELDKWPHFKDSSDMYSINDMIGLHNGVLLTDVQVVHKLFFSHVNQECENCLNHGKICCICRSPEKLFKFTKDTVNCQRCLAIFHKSCSPNSTKCPVCTKQRKSIF